MFRTLIMRIKHILELDLFKFIYFNFLCKKVIRAKGCYLIPYKNSKIQLGKNARIKLNGNISVGINKLYGSKAETYIRLADDATWIVESAAIIYFNVLIEVHKNATLSMVHCGINSGSVIVCKKEIRIGNHVMLGRNVLIYDSDHHDILDSEGNKLNENKSVIIGDKVWLTSNIIILKGAIIGSGSIVAGYSSISKELPPKSLIGGTPAKVIKEANEWVWDLQ